jgi:hypothetical protein
MHFKMEGPMMFWDSNLSNMEESNANEREWAMGFCTNFTVVPTFFRGHKWIFGQVMDLIASHGFSI